MPTRAKRSITAQDLYAIQLLSDPRISPDGQHVAFCLQRVDKKTEKKHANLWIVPTDGGRARQFTYGDQVDAHPRWSPDGEQIAFISNRGNEKQPQIHLIPFRGGEARPLTDLQGEIGEFEWSPDGKQLVCQFRKRDQEAIELEQDQEKKKLGLVSRHITRTFFKLDGYGFLPIERWHIWTINARTGRGKQLTDHAVYDEESPRWSPDGRWIAFTSNRTEDPDLDPDVIDLFVLPAEGGEARRIETPLGPKGSPSWSPDGKWIAYYGREGRGQWWKLQRLWIVPTDGSGPAVNLTADHDFHISSWTLNDLAALPMIPPTWSTDGSAIFFQLAHHGDTTLQTISVPEGRVRPVIADRGVVGAFTLDRDQTKLAYFFGDMTDPGQVWVMDEASGAKRKLTSVNGRSLGRINLGQIEEVWFQGADDNDVQGWVIKPPEFDPSVEYPSILEIHGGPRLQYGNFMMHEFFYLAAQGYVVYFCNPRGSQGYGEEHARSIWNDWGNVDYADLMAWADYMRDQPYIDSARMGVTGGSYGGYMTCWIIGHTDRFKAAVTQRSVSNLVSMWGSSDMNWTFQDEFGERAPWEDMDSLHSYWRQSPIAFIGNAATPTLIIHSEQDLRCDMEQDEQVYVALKRLGVPTEMVRFPDEPHGLSRGGRTDRRIVRLQHIVRWFDRHMKDGA